MIEEFLQQVAVAAEERAECVRIWIINVFARSLDKEAWQLVRHRLPFPLRVDEYYY